MDSLGSVIGIVSGLIGIFSFVTGIQSVAQLRTARQRGSDSHPGLPRSAARRLLVVGPLFGVSIVVTAAVGLLGSDTGGILCLLLTACLVAVVGFHWLAIDRLLPLNVYGIVATCGIAGLGLLAGTIGRGEEGFGLAAGIAIGVGSWVITALTRRPGRPSEPAPPSGPRAEQADHSVVDSDCERTILQIAKQQNGQVRVTDVALGSDFSLDQARHALDDLASRQHCLKETLPSGAAVYRFPDLELT
jgi:hypothetical protein